MSKIYYINTAIDLYKNREQIKDIYKFDDSFPLKNKNARKNFQNIKIVIMILAKAYKLNDDLWDLIVKFIYEDRYFVFNPSLYDFNIMKYMEYYTENITQQTYNNIVIKKNDFYINNYLKAQKDIDQIGMFIKNPIIKTRSLYTVHIPNCGYCCLGFSFCKDYDVSNILYCSLRFNMLEINEPFILEERYMIKVTNVELEDEIETQYFYYHPTMKIIPTRLTCYCEKCIVFNLKNNDIALPTIKFLVLMCKDEHNPSQNMPHFFDNNKLKIENGSISIVK